MKILIVDHSTDVQQRWMDPLRKDGWAVFRARNLDDATKMLAFHAKSLNYIVAGEHDVEWAEKSNFPFVLITKNWTDQEILKHKSSKRAAIAYFPRTITAMEIKAAIENRKSSLSPAAPMPATSSLSLENFGEVLSKPEPTRTHTLSSIRLHSPSVFLGGVDAPPSAEDAQATAIYVSTKSSPKAEAVNKAPPAPVSGTLSLLDDEPAGPQAAPLEMETRAVDASKMPPPTPDATRVSMAPISPSNAGKQIEITLNRPIKLEPSSPTSADDAAATVVVSRASLQASAPQSSVGEISLMNEVSSPNISEPAFEKTVILESTKLGMEQLNEVEEVQLDPISEDSSISIPSFNEDEAESYDLASGDDHISPAQSPRSHLQAVSSIHSNSSSYSRGQPSGPASNDTDTLKSYLALREQDVALLTGQVRSSQERIYQLEMQLKVEKARSTELQHVVQKQEQIVKTYDQDKKIEIEVLYKQVEDLNLQLKERTDKTRSIEAKLKMTLEEVDKVKERVRMDIRRIRVREKELEGQLEVLKKDSAALLMSRDEKILELKRKLDLLEFNMELVQEQYQKEKRVSDQLRTKLNHAASAMREAGGMLDREN